MIEPPEPRHPDEEGGGEDWEAMERNAARDFVADNTPDMQEAIDALREELGDEGYDAAVAEVLRRVREKDQLAELDDDMLLDQLGRGGDGAPLGRGEDDEMTDMLGGWRDDVDSVPHSPGTSPENIQQIHDFNQEVERATAPPRPTEGESQPVSAQEEAARLRQLAGNTSAVAALQEAATQLETMMGEIQSALGQGHSQLDAAIGPLQQAIADVNAAAVTVGNALGSLEGIAGQIG